MAEQRIDDGFRDFDQGYSSLQRDLPTLSDLEITPRINKLVAILNPIGANFESIGTQNKLILILASLQNMRHEY
jgi:hypothetical protein